MLKRFSIKQKMLIIILFTSIVTYTLTLFYVGQYMRVKAIDDAKKLADLGAREKANRIETDFEGYLSLARAMATMVREYPQLTPAIRFERERELLGNVQDSDQDLKQVWLSWEFGVLDPTWMAEHGRERHAYTNWPDGSRREFQDTTDLDTWDPTNFYYQLRATKNEGAAGLTTLPPMPGQGCSGPAL